MKKYIQPSIVVENGVLQQSIMAGSVYNEPGDGEDAANAGVFDKDDNLFLSTDKGLWED